MTLEDLLNQQLDKHKPALSRRQFVTGLTSASALLGLGTQINVAIAASLSNKPQVPILRGNNFDLEIGYQKVNITGRDKIATTINGSLAGPTLRWKEGERVTLKVTNKLAVDTSIHWHGLILPTEMDGVPGLSFKGIKPGETFEYSFLVKQNGSYWYHSHSGFQEQTGVYGAIIIDPKEPDPVAYDHDHVIMLSDWSDESPESVYKKLKKMSEYYQANERTSADLLQDIKQKGIKETWRARAMWNTDRMSDRDISDVGGYAYTYLMNGQTPEQNWQALFKQGEKVRLRFINAAAMTFFDVRIPGLKMTVVASDGQNIAPVTVDEFRIGVAETYDVIVEPQSDVAYCLFAQAIDRSGYAAGTLSANTSLKAPVPTMDPAPILDHSDMGMAGHNMSIMEHTSMGHASTHASMQHKIAENSKQTIETGLAGYGSASKIKHVKTEFGPHVDMHAETPQYRLNDPGIGLREHQKLYGRKVLTYADIKNLTKTIDPRQPEREIELHLTGNMSRYMWSLNGIKFADAEPLQLKYGERVRMTLVNDTMMNHPMHLHGMWSELETGDPDYIPRKHTVIVQPGSKISYLLTADAKGRWAFHCHLMYHMLGMFREVRVS